MRENPATPCVSKGKICQKSRARVTYPLDQARRCGWVLSPPKHCYGRDLGKKNRYTHVVGRSSRLHGPNSSHATCLQNMRIYSRPTELAAEPISTHQSVQEQKFLRSHYRNYPRKCRVMPPSPLRRQPAPGNHLDVVVPNSVWILRSIHSAAHIISDILWIITVYTQDRTLL